MSNVVQSLIADKRQKAKEFYDRRAKPDLPHVAVGDYVYTKPSPHRQGQAWQYGQVIWMDPDPTLSLHLLVIPDETVHRSVQLWLLHCHHKL